MSRITIPPAPPRMSLKSLLLPLLAATLTLVWSCTGGGGSETQKAMIGKPAPAFSGTALDGKPLSLEAERGKVVLIDFWATWCPPCRAAIPKVKKVEEHFAGRPFTVLGVNLDQGKVQAKVSKFLTDNSVKARQLMQGAARVAGQYKVQGIPCMFLIDQQGVVQDVLVGLVPSLDQELIRKVDTLLSS